MSFLTEWGKKWRKKLIHNPNKWWDIFHLIIWSYMIVLVTFLCTRNIFICNPFSLNHCPSRARVLQQWSSCFSLLRKKCCSKPLKPSGDLQRKVCMCWAIHTHYLTSWSCTMLIFTCVCVCVGLLMFSRWWEHKLSDGFGGSGTTHLSSNAWE